MKLVPNAKDIALHSHSMWGYYLSLAVLVMPEVLFGVFGVETSPYVLWGAAIAVATYGMFGRMIYQGLSE
ncbi:MAG: hypothetical protein ABJO27_02385 [Pseudoruegeria sp.]